MSDRYNEPVWAGLEEEKRNKLPTPPVGTPVQWYQGGDRRMVFAGQVLAVEVPGRVTIRIAAPGKFAEDKKGVYHVSYRMHKVPGHQNTQKCGSWDYLPGHTVHKRDYGFHEEELEKRELNLLNQEEQARKIAAAKAEAGV
jgi:hypothetical protein